MTIRDLCDNGRECYVIVRRSLYEKYGISTYVSNNIYDSPRPVNAGEVLLHIKDGVVRCIG